jgi:Sulfotransferase domain
MLKYKEKVFSLVHQWYRHSDLYINHRSKNINIYHCTVQKSGSQWVLQILSDQATYQYSGLELYQPEKEELDRRKLTERSQTKPFPLHTIVTPFYIDYENFAAMPKPNPYKAFFVMRDPRDILVSWYFSSKFSHSLIGNVGKVREVLHRQTVVDGLLYSIDHLNNYGLFAAQYSWLRASGSDPNVMVVRYEDLISANFIEVFQRIFNHCDIQIPEKTLSFLLSEHSFEKLSGRQRGEEDQKAYYRKGVQGDWKNYFNDKIYSYFRNVTGDLIERWGYEL